MSQGFIDDDDDDDEPAMPRKKRPEEEMDITPMIDITFLLLIFFVVASKMDPTQTGKIPEATNGLAISAKDSAVIFIEPAGGDSPAILRRYDGSEFSKDEETATSEIVEYLTGELEKSIGTNKNQVMLLGDAEVKVSEVTRVQKIVGDAFQDLEFTYIAVKEQ
ncbi:MULTISPECIES: ExbD/TolR family protein [Rhodopirellula]|jgi:biopolymer transport protein ExbD|nr:MULTISPECIES: biopolymer transporter ExbD [Rhodopirellula]EMI24091.1 biopolymer transport exbD2 protein [Rhodopirellula europaea SH398]MAP09712.1 biopolymer transporter ExbD [Rhodopirellula sp.]MCR9208280.1 biopolymer transporter ExbD [bacterium]|tara:strand:+ start:34472 stop:34960 length:489 start_codon:yes stop_codon:yes gene_type:complete